MIKTLQRKFIVIAMTAITVLILLLLGGINIVNIVIVSNQIDKTLMMISENEGNPENIPMKPDKMSPPPVYGPKNEHDIFMSSNFFVIRYDNYGKIVFADVSRLSSLSEQEAIEMASAIYEQNEATGKIKQYRYMVRNSRSGLGKVVVCLDTSGEIYSYVRVLFLSAGIGIACWIVMLLFVALLSQKAIKPIAESIEKQKQFVTNAGHEIKTPLAIIQSNIEALELYNGENKWSKNIKGQTVRLNDLMRNLLTLARMDENMAALPVSDISLSQLLSEYTENFSESFKMKEISIQRNIQPSIMFRANREHIAQLISVLLDNAVKYTIENGTVYVSLVKNDRRIILQIGNTCEQLPPIPPEKLFDRFYRSDEARTQRSGGYGIGLSVAKSIAETYKGTLTAEYQNANTIMFTARF